MEQGGDLAGQRHQHGLNSQIEHPYGDPQQSLSYRGEPFGGVDGCRMEVWG